MAATGERTLLTTCQCGNPGKIFIKGRNYCDKCVEAHLPEVRPIPLSMDDPRSWWQEKPRA